MVDYVVDHYAMQSAAGLPVGSAASQHATTTAACKDPRTRAARADARAGASAGPLRLPAAPCAVAAGRLGTGQRPDLSALHARRACSYAASCPSRRKMSWRAANATCRSGRTRPGAWTSWPISSSNGTRFRALTIVDVFSREALAIEVGKRLRRRCRGCLQSARGATRGAPKRVFVDNGSEFSGRMFDLWAYHHGVQIDFSRPGSRPTTASSRRSTDRFATSA